MSRQQKTTQTPKIKEYKVIYAPISDVLECFVEELICEGWVPQGGVCFTNFNSNKQYTQAMIKIDQ
jgi:hypothetical protein